MKGASSNDFLGEGAAALADLDGDGFREIAVSGEEPAGRRLLGETARSCARTARRGDVLRDGDLATGDSTARRPDYVVGAYGGGVRHSGATGASVYGWGR